MKKSVRFLAALLSGLGTVATVFAVPTFQHRASGSDLQRMRGDVERVGNTMRKVIRRENERQASQANT